MKIPSISHKGKCSYCIQVLTNTFVIAILHISYILQFQFTGPVQLIYSLTVNILSTTNATWKIMRYYTVNAIYYCDATHLFVIRKLCILTSVSDQFYIVVCTLVGRFIHEIQSDTYNLQSLLTILCCQYGSLRSL